MSNRQGLIILAVAGGAAAFLVLGGAGLWYTNRRSKSSSSVSATRAVAPRFVGTDAVWDAQNVFQTAAKPKWSFINQGATKEYELVDWAYDSASDLIQLRLKDSSSVVSQFYAKWLAADKWQQQTAPTDPAPKAYKRLVCDATSCTSPFICSSGSCVVNPANRAAGETIAVPFGNNAAYSLNLLATARRFIDKNAQTSLMEWSNSVFATPLPTVTMTRNNVVRVYQLVSWSYNPAAYLELKINLRDTSDSSQLFLLMYGASPTEIHQLATTNNPYTEWIAYSGAFCDPRTCTAPNACSGAPPVCRLANRDPTDTDTIPAGSAAAQLLQILSTGKDWLERNSGSSLVSNAPIYQTSSAPTWTVRTSGGTTTVRTLVNWSYKSAVGDIIKMTTNSATFYLKWRPEYTSTYHIQELNNPNDGNPIQYQIASSVFSCTASPCTVSSRNRAPGNSTVVSLGSKPANMLGLLAVPGLQLVDQNTGFRYWINNGSIFDTVLPTFTINDNNGTPQTYTLVYWAYVPADNGPDAVRLTLKSSGGTVFDLILTWVSARQFDQEPNFGIQFYAASWFDYYSP